MIAPGRLRSQRGCSRFEVSPLHRFVSFEDVRATLLTLKDRDLPAARRIAARLRREARRNEILTDWLFQVMFTAVAWTRFAALAASEVIPGGVPETYGCAV